jgi:hypothetical protein
MNSTTVARDTRTRPPMPPPKGVMAVSENQGVSWVQGKKWTPDRGYGFFYIGPTMYRVTFDRADALSQTWLVSKVIERKGEPDELANPYTVTLPVGGSGFAASCDCAGFRWRGQCRHASGTVAALESLEVHEITDDAVDRFEATERLAECGAAN